MGLLWPLKSLMTFFSPPLTKFNSACIPRGRWNFNDVFKFFNTSVFSFFMLCFLCGCVFVKPLFLVWDPVVPDLFKESKHVIPEKEWAETQSTKQPQIGCGNGAFLRPNHPHYGISVLNKWLSFCSLLVELNKVCLVNARKGTICFKILNKSRKITFKKLQQSLTDNKLKRNISFLFLDAEKELKISWRMFFSVFRSGNVALIMTLKASLHTVLLLMHVSCKKTWSLCFAQWRQLN